MPPSWGRSFAALVSQHRNNRSVPRELRTALNAYTVATLCHALALALPHAVLTPILLAKGLGIADILTLQFVFSTVVLIAEVPSGILSDRFSRKTVYLASKALIVAFFLQVYYADSYIDLAIAWLVYGLSAALDSGTIGDELIARQRELQAKAVAASPGAHDPVDWLVRYGVRLESLSMMGGGFIGSIIYAAWGLSLYSVAAGLALIAAIVTMVWFPSGNAGRSSGPEAPRGGGVRHILRSGVSQAFRDTRVRILLLTTCVVQIFFQVHFHLWQALFLELGINAGLFGTIYVVFHAISFLVSFVSLRLLLRRSRRHGATVLLAIGLSTCAALSAALYVRQPLLVLASYVVAVFFFTLLVNDLTARLRKVVKVETISTLSSLSSMLSRVAALGVLAASSAALHVLSVTVVVPVGFIVAVTATCVLYRQVLRRLEA